MLDVSSEAVRVKVVEVETSAAHEVAVPRELLESPIYAHVRRTHERLREVTGGLPPFTLKLGKKDAAAETFEALRDRALELAKEGIQISRFKGLGEMNHEQLWDTTMDPARRMLIRVDVEDASARRPLVLPPDGRPGRAAPRVHRAERAGRAVPRCLWIVSDITHDPIGGGRIESRELEQEMRSSFLDYAMSVIVSRALPDVRDGLKPVHRRVLYGMHDNGLQPNRPYKKSRERRRRRDGQLPPARRRVDLRHARAHGAAVLAALPARRRPGQLRLARRRPRGGDALHRVPAHAARHRDAARHRRRHRRLRAELRRVAHASRLVLPSRFPNLLVNGSSGIAVGMATNMPPHHLGEVIDAVVAMIDKPDIDVEGLMKHVKGPDFPTGGYIVGRSGIRDAYRTGRGRIVMRARAHIEELRGGKNAIIVTELPYGVRKGGEGGVIEKIAELVESKVLTEIPMNDDALADHSDKDGMRIYIELKREAIPQVALNKLFKHTPLQTLVRLQRRRARRRRAEDAVAARADPPLPRLPARGRHAPLEVRAAQGRGRARTSSAAT